MLKQKILSLQLELAEARQPYAIATVVEIIGSSSAKPAANALINKMGKVVLGWIGGGCAQAMVAKAALNCLESGESCVVEIDLNDEVFGAGMPCGGSMRVFVEPVLPNPILWLMGHGRIVESISEFALRVGFDVVVNDPQANAERFPANVRIISDDSRYQQLQPNSNDFVVIATHHKGDYDSLIRALQSEAVYIALISSRKRADIILTRLRQEGISETQLARIHAPAGLALGAKFPEEIALSIVSEMVMVRRGGHGGSIHNGLQKND